MIIPIPRQIMEIIYNEDISYDCFKDSDVISAMDLIGRIKTEIHKHNHIVIGKDIDFSFTDYRQMQILIVVLSNVKARNNKNFIENWIRSYRRNVEKHSPDKVNSERERKIKEFAPKILNSALSKLNDLCTSTFPDMDPAFSPKAKITWDKRRLNSESGFDKTKGSKYGGFGAMEVTIRKRFNADYTFQKTRLNHICGVLDDKRFGSFDTNLWQIYLLTEVCYNYHNIVCEYRKFHLGDQKFDSIISSGSTNFYILIREKIINPILIKNKIRVGVK